ncbi:hypothetical protein PYCCODRAFT_1482768 [Trametes coccinea BRFM310]|uniref:C2H2-type domain-containing protein n=1 Tax=Trametes coccinea (strain BRFM310) TaxID=1353009 RepID=A0A1Y2J4R5_TRAC3|nr:hypothetical protein PYCCODRAFT_1482768 [Trametes coccinea BRFM310]
MSSSTTCPGCDTPFSFSGLTKHLSQATDPRCLAAYNQDYAAIEQNLLTVDLDAPPVPFQGDFFGDYGPQDFPEQDVDMADAAPPNITDVTRDDQDEQHNSTPGSSCPPPDAGGLRTVVVPYPDTSAGSAVKGEDTSRTPCLTYDGYQTALGGPSSNPYAPFTSETDWQVARWAKLRGPGSTSFTELVTIPGIVQKLALSYKNSRELNNIIDKLPAGRPPFEREEISIAGEIFEVFLRDILACIRALLGDPEFTPILLLVPERHYTDDSKTVEVYFDMNTGKWWWATQEALDKQCPGATVIPLTLIGNKSAYPVYMTLGNLPKHIRCKPSRRGQILVAYLPTTRLLNVTGKQARRRTLANLFHACMTRVDGIHFASGDGTVRRGHPILATYVGDYPEQLLVACIKNGECPKCEVARNDLGQAADTSRVFRNLGKVLDALSALDDGALAFARACREAGIKEVVHPFWEDLPYTNIFVAITPDILHQLYQGVIKHLIAWLQDAYGAEEIDARCARLPPNHNLRHFSKGISHLSRVTGKEHQDISRILLGLIIGLPLPSGASASRLVCATRALLDFLYLAQYPTHTSQSLKRLDDALLTFHTNKSIFLFGTTDNYDTQYSERLHIDLTKDAYRATNTKDEFSQMTKWLERKEKVQRHDMYVAWRLSRRSASSEAMTKHPSAKGVTFDDIVNKYSAPFFRDALARFIVTLNNPSLTTAQTELACGSIYFNFRAVSVYHKARFFINDVQHLGTSTSTAEDVAHARPSRVGKYGEHIPARFDTVLVRSTPGLADRSAIQGFRVAQVRVIFKLPEKALGVLFPRLDAAARPRHLAYVEWFSTVHSGGANPHPDHRLYKVSRSLHHGSRLATASVIPVEQIERTCHLLPDFGPVAPRDWTSSNVLEEARTFLLNTFMDRNMYMLIG